MRGGVRVARRWRSGKRKKSGKWRKNREEMSSKDGNRDREVVVIWRREEDKCTGVGSRSNVGRRWEHVGGRGTVHYGGVKKGNKTGNGWK